MRAQGKMPVATLLGLTATLLVIEVASRIGLQGLDGVDPLHDQQKAELLSRQPPAHTLIVGDSTGHRGIDARVFAEEAGTSTLNAACTSCSPISIRLILREQQRLPNRVIVSMVPVLLGDTWPAEPHEMAAATVLERSALSGWGNGVVYSAWKTYARRVEWKRVLLSLRGQLPPATAATADDAYGSLAFKSDAVSSAPEASALLDRWLAGSTPRLGARARALDGLAAEWRAASVEVVYVIMPASSHLRAALEEHHAASFARDALAGITARHGGRVLDCIAAVPDSGFYDADHLKDGRLREAFSKALARAVVSKTEVCPVVD